MPVEPVHRVADDPAEILRALPEKWHAQFLSEYHAALDAAHDLTRFARLQEMLRTWGLHAGAVSRPAFEVAERAVREDRRGEFVPMDDASPRWPDCR
ncbi:DUF6247 family protein [Actinopolymorpha sp. NPDC004070]|uniref:DUF6247 family protein n=1 Tax=Actinopolymorpha sp. NPDC004070 TaxID=3154548 RepID=UPI00339DEEF3